MEPLINDLSPENIRKNLNIYLLRGRFAYLEMLNSIKPNSDFIVDGSLSIDDITNQIYERINGISNEFNKVKSFL